jgi:hypothetical protein
MFDFNSVINKLHLPLLSETSYRTNVMSIPNSDSICLPYRKFEGEAGIGKICSAFCEHVVVPCAHPSPILAKNLNAKISPVTAEPPPLAVPSFHTLLALGLTIHRSPIYGISVNEKYYLTLL